MFLSWEYIKYLGYNNKTNEHSYQYKIMDTDFGVVVDVDVVAVVAVAVAVVEAGVVAAVIDTYKKRNLPVAANLMKAILYVAKKHNYPINQIIENNKKYNPKFAKYEKDLHKYLVLI